MNPADVAQTAMAAPSADLSLIGLFLQAHFIVKLVMAGLVIASVWVWAIIIDKTILFARMKRQMEPFRAGFPWVLRHDLDFSGR